MGQYYTLVNVTKKTGVAHNFDLIGGTKLCEHSWLKNPLAIYLRNKLALDWKGDVILHIGDYASENDGTNTAPVFQRMLDAGVITQGKNGRQLYEKEVKLLKYKDDYRYVANINKKSYIDMEKVFPSHLYIEKKEKNYQVWIGCLDPLLLLIACGNGQGGGDYHGKAENFVGYWAGDHLFATNDENELEGYHESIFMFVEDIPDVQVTSEKLLYVVLAKNAWPYDETKYLDCIDHNLPVVIKCCPKYWHKEVKTFLELWGYKTHQ